VGLGQKERADRFGQEVESSEFVSLESLASLVARIALRDAIRPNDIITVRAAKPKALVFADAAEVEIVRTSSDYPATTHVDASIVESQSLGPGPPLGPSALNLLGQNVMRDPSSLSGGSPQGQGQHFAAIALGSNLGDRFARIEAALHLLDHPELLYEERTSQSVTVINTSFLYETAPMYVTDQPSFLNCACIVRPLSTIPYLLSFLVLQIRTNVAPPTLLEILKTIEYGVGRQPSIRNGPRAIDLDVLFYDDACIDTRSESLKGTLEDLEGHLVVPHPRMAEREFVLRPLYELASVPLFKTSL
jgi:dihydroneopterin aldolase/2-amino-4-hydroxy-6-hydroxymethyldihydropteridine diphosphokinase/dihydropteroate synthase